MNDLEILDAVITDLGLKDRLKEHFGDRLVENCWHGVTGTVAPDQQTLMAVHLDACFKAKEGDEKSFRLPRNPEEFAIYKTSCFWVHLDLMRGLPDPILLTEASKRPSRK